MEPSASIVAWAKKAVSLGAGELLVTSMDHDGTHNGYAIGLLKAISRSVRVPVIASGGAGRYSHFYDAIATGGASAVLAASLFHYRQMSIQKLKQYLAGKKIPVRKDY